jgi:hypothetical protein
MARDFTSEQYQTNLPVADWVEPRDGQETQ